MWLNKKSVRTTTVAYPTLGGSGMPIEVGQATQKPHAEYDITNQLKISWLRYMHIHKASTVATVLTPIEIFQISECQERAQ